MRNKVWGAYEPKKCWVGESQKICYDTREEAEVAARCAEYEHGAPELAVYKCEYGDHWHLTTSIDGGEKDEKK